MYAVKVWIKSVTDEAQPVFVECVLTDYNGQTHYFRDKLPVFSAELNPTIPGEGMIRCSLLNQTDQYADVSTALPDNVESTMGFNQFRIALSDLI